LGTFRSEPLRITTIAAYTSYMVNDWPVAAAELRRNLSEHLDSLLRGRSIEVSRHGRVVAVLAPVDVEETDNDD
jgi:prevent-host-death family protein